MERLVGDKRDDRQDEEGQDDGNDDGRRDRDQVPAGNHGGPKPAALSFACPAGERTCATNAWAAARFRLAFTTAMKSLAPGLALRGRRTTVSLPRAASASVM